MKKSILAVALMAMVSMTASAVSINWTSDALSFDGTLIKSSAAVSAYLVYLGNGAFAAPYDVIATFDPSTIGPVTSSDTETNRRGVINGTFTFDYGTYKNGDSFGLLVSYTDSNGETFYNLSSVVNTISGLDTEVSVPVFNDFTFNSDTSETIGKLYDGSGWTAAVPEPATGALALAGVALLFRRKRA